MAPRINNKTIPTHMAYSGFYLPARATVNVRNGQGVLKSQSLPQVIWSWNILSKLEIDWWNITLLNGEVSKLFQGSNSHELFDYRGELVQYSQCVVDAPSYGRYSGGAFRDVQIQITQLK